MVTFTRIPATRREVLAGALKVRVALGGTNLGKTTLSNETSTSGRSWNEKLPIATVNTVNEAMCLYLSTTFWSTTKNRSWRNYFIRL